VIDPTIRRACHLALVMTVSLAACGGGPSAATTDGTAPVVTADEPSTTTSSPLDGTLGGEPDDSGLTMCVEVGYPTAPEDWYSDSPIYVGNEMPVEEVGAFARELEGYENIWIDREHNGWVTVGFVDADVAAHQAALEAEFPDAGVVAVAMPIAVEDLELIRQRIDEALPADMNAWNVYDARGVVSVWVHRLTPERIALVEDIVGDDPACLEGVDPELAPVPGPQPDGGDGWTYLAAVDNMMGERPIVIADSERLAEAWAALGLEDEPAAVDFQTRIVVAFPFFYSGSCPESRFDDVVVEGGVVYPVVVYPGTEQWCTADANPRTYLIGMERDVLPSPPFRIFHSKETVLTVQVTADLRQPGSVPTDAQVEDVVAPRPRSATATPTVIETGFPWPITIDVSCGIDYLGVINGVGWHTAEDTGGLPPAWEDETVDGLLDVELLMTDGPHPTLAATAGGHEVLYLPGADDGAACD
jgi:hypothetical protein